MGNNSCWREEKQQQQQQQQKYNNEVSLRNVYVYDVVNTVHIARVCDIFMSLLYKIHTGKDAIAKEDSYRYRHRINFIIDDVFVNRAGLAALKAAKEGRNFWSVDEITHA